MIKRFRYWALAPLWNWLVESDIDNRPLAFLYSLVSWLRIGRWL